MDLQIRLKNRISLVDLGPGGILQGINLTVKDRHYLTVKRWNTVFLANVTRKQSGIIVLKSDKRDFTLKLVREIKEDNLTLIMGTI